MTITQLRYFVALADHLHFSRTADSLHISQPSLTQHIKNLEQELGTKLFVRTNGGIFLTESGQRLKEDVEEILDRLGRLRTFTPDGGRAPMPKTFRVTYDASAFTLESEMSEVFVTTLRKLKNLCPMTEIKLEVPESATDTARLLRDNGTDICVSMVESVIDSSMEAQFVSSQRLYILTPKLDGGREALLEFMNKDPVYMVSYDLRMSSRISNYLMNSGVTSTLQLIKTPYQVALYVRLGKGSAIIPENRIYQDLDDYARRELMLTPIDEIKIDRYMVWRRDNSNPLLPMFIETFNRELEARGLSRNADQ